MPNQARISKQMKQSEFWKLMYGLSPGAREAMQSDTSKATLVLIGVASTCFARKKEGPAVDALREQIISLEDKGVFTFFEWDGFGLD